MKHLTPHTLEQAVDLLATGEMTILAGGTDFYPSLGDKTPEKDILDLSAISELRHISQAADGWYFGACTTWSDISRANLPAAFFCLQQAAKEVGSLQIQNTGTIAGNLCNASPAADGVPALLVLNAEVILSSQRGTRRLPLAQFINGVRRTDLANDELVSGIFIPHPSEKAKGAFSKLGARRYLVISICMVAVIIVPNESGHVAEAAISVGACSPVALRLTKLEDDLIGLPLDALKLQETAKLQHLEELTPIDDVRGSAAYRKEAVLEIVRRTIADAL